MRIYNISNHKKIIIPDGFGVKRFSTESAIGKTYLCNIIERYSEFCKGLDYYRYSSRNKESINESLNNLLKSDNDVIILDRYDLLRNDNIDSEVLKCSSNKLILLDYKVYNSKKENSRIYFTDELDVTITEEGIIVE